MTFLRLAVFAGLVLSAAFCLGQENKKPKMVRVPTAGNKAKVVDETKEPPLFFELKIGDKTFRGKVGDAIKITGNFKDADAKITTEKSRSFNYAGVRFSYPEKMYWDASVSDESSKSWVMSGSTCSINVFDVEDEKYTAADYSKVLIEDFDTDDFDEEEFKIELGGKSYEGIRMVFEFDGESYVYDIIQLPVKNGRSRLILLEEVAPDRDPDNLEAKEVLKLFKKSFQLSK